MNIVKMYTEENMSLRAISKELRISREKVRKVLEEAGIEIVKKPRSDLDISGETQIKKKYYIYQQNAKRRGYEFTLTYEEFKEKLLGNCKYCGCEPDTPFTNSPNREFAHYIMVNTLDRIDSDEGYTNENTVSCCKMCNSMKSDFRLKDWFKKMKMILDYNKNNEVK